MNHWNVKDELLYITYPWSTFKKFYFVNFMESQFNRIMKQNAFFCLFLFC